MGALSGRGQAARALSYSDMPTVARFLGVVGKSIHRCDQMQLSPICRKSQTAAPIGEPQKTAKRKKVKGKGG